MEEIENPELWQNLRNGDKEALFLLYNNLYFHLVRFGLKTCADDELVKDCVTQLFLQLWDKRQKLPVVTSVRSYLYTALKRDLLDQLAYQTRVDSTIQKLNETEEMSECSYEEMIINIQHDKDVKRKLKSALDHLTPRQVELIRLKFFEGLSYEQISLHTAQSIKTAYNTIYDAIKTLRRILQ